MRFLILFLISTSVFASNRYDNEANSSSESLSTAESSVSAEQSSFTGMSNSYLSLIGNITQPQPHNCFVPAKGKGRSWNVFYLVSTSGLLALDPDCWAEYKAQNEHTRDMERLKLEILKLEAEADIERLRNEVIACRQREACQVDK